MSIFRLKNERGTEKSIDKHALLFGLISVFLCGIGFSIIMPVVPFLVQPYTSNPEEQALVVTLLTSVYAACVFLTAPVLGALSDKYGRRPLLLICLFGSAIGYLVLGIGGTIIGPTIGGILAKFGDTVPIYFGAIITLINVVYGIKYMPESLEKNNRLKEITFVRLNPFVQLANILSMKNLKWLLVSAFLLWIPNGSLQAIFTQFTMDTFSWKPALIGLMFSILGFQDIVSQSFIMPKLLIKLSDKQIAILGMVSEIIGYSFIAASALFSLYPLLIAGMLMYGFGDSIFGPSFNGMLSKSVSSSEQGRIQGGSQSIQALARMIGPILGGQIYVSLGHAAPAFMGMILIVAAIAVLYKGTHETV